MVRRVSRGPGRMEISYTLQGWGAHPPPVKLFDQDMLLEPVPSDPHSHYRQIRRIQSAQHFVPRPDGGSLWLERSFNAALSLSCILPLVCCPALLSDIVCTCLTPSTQALSTDCCGPMPFVHSNCGVRAASRCVTACSARARCPPSQAFSLTR